MTNAQVWTGSGVCGDVALMKHLDNELLGAMHHAAGINKLVSHNMLFQMFNME